MMFKALCGVICVFVLQLCVTNASHFRGGTVSWKYLSSQGGLHQVEIAYRWGWRRDWETPQCDDAMIANQTEGYSTTGGSWSSSTSFSHVTSSSSSSSPPTTILCTTYDLLENWAYGYNSFTIEVGTADPFTISFRGNAWISGLYKTVSSNWLVPAVLDLGVRSDTSQVNNPPRTFSPPVVRLKLGCPSSVKIHYIDDDGDNVTCRTAGIGNTVLSDECGGVCIGLYQHFSLDKDTCTIHYDGGGGDYLIPVALMLEDHPHSTITVQGSSAVTVTPSDHLSQIPLQFLFSISTTDACNVVPSYPPGDSIPENDTITVPKSGGSLDEKLYAFPSNASAIIMQFVVLGPVGVQSSHPIFINATGAYVSNITWHPDPSQAGRHIICYYAVDSFGQTGQQRCFSVVVTEIFNPCGTDNGGCNDLCVQHGPTRSCQCSSSCWGLLDNQRTCAPSMDVTCNGLDMLISLPTCASNRTIIAGSHEDHYLNPTCQSVISGNTHHMSFNRYQCGVSSWSAPSYLRYGTDLWIWHEEEKVPAIITRGEWRRIPVSCTMETTGTVNGSFVPELPYNYDFFPTDVSIEGMGSYSFYFEFYYSGNFAGAVSPADSPLQVSVKDRLYFTLGAVGHGGLVFFTDRCTATTTDADGVSILSYTFIEDGCFLDPTLARHYSAYPMEDRISMQAFEFDSKLLVNRDNAEIFLQCDVMLCDASDNTTRCFQGCQPSGTGRSRSTRGIISRVARQAPLEDDDDDDDDDNSFRMTTSQSPLQKASTTFKLTGSGGSSAGHVYGNWVLIGIANALFIVQHLLHTGL